MHGWFLGRDEFLHGDHELDFPAALVLFDREIVQLRHLFRRMGLSEAPLFHSTSLLVDPYIIACRATGHARAPRGKPH
jgi:hypothetical protein